jgi:hypothetical protein
MKQMKQEYLAGAGNCVVGSHDMTKSWTRESQVLGSGPRHQDGVGHQIGPRRDFLKDFGSRPTNEVRPMDWAPPIMVSKVFVSRRLNDSFVKDIVFGGTGETPEGMGKAVGGRPTEKELQRDTKKLLGLMGVQIGKEAQEAWATRTAGGSKAAEARPRCFGTSYAGNGRLTGRPVGK